MKIQRINLYTSPKLLNTQFQFNKYSSGLNKDTFSFTGIEEKPKRISFIDNLKLKFTKPQIPQIACYMPRKNFSDLTDEEIKSENIKKFVGETIASYGGLDILGKANKKEINSMLRLGADNFYEGTISYNYKENKNITFSDINSETGVPKNINVWEDGQYAYSYEILNKEPLEYVVNIKADNLETTESGLDNRLIQFVQVDKQNSTVKVFDATENGFNYLYGTQDSNGSNIQIIKRLYFDFNDIDGCIYAEGASEGIYLYFYNQEDDIWEQKYLLEFED